MYGINNANICTYKYIYTPPEVQRFYTDEGVYIYIHIYIDFQQMRVFIFCDRVSDHNFVTERGAW